MCENIESMKHSLFFYYIGVPPLLIAKVKFDWHDERLL